MNKTQREIMYEHALPLLRRHSEHLESIGKGADAASVRATIAHTEYRLMVLRTDRELLESLNRAINAEILAVIAER